ENTNDGHGAAMNKKQIPPPAALFGYSHLYGGVPGGQAEYVRVLNGFVHQLDKLTAGVFTQQFIPTTAPHDFDNVPASTCKDAFQ
ncbi:hypothetical protein ONR49_25460, partial [Salmonella enterica subsp. enterica serovar Virginia]|nr:hypothetical protein [Salmonella enterica subsp. enterica serovar Virginia]